MRLPELYIRAVFIDADGVAVEAQWDIDSGFKITFTIDKVSNRKPDSAEVTVYNLPPTIQKKICTDAVDVALYAGGSTPPPLLFRGPVTDAIAYRSSDYVDTMTTVYAEDTKRDLRGVSIGRSFGAGTAIRTVLLDIAAASGSAIDVTAVSGRTTAPIPLLGPPSRLIDEVCQLYGYRYQIVAGVLIVIGADAPLPTPSVPVVNKLTGMRGVPSSNREKGVVKITATTGLNALIQAGGLCIIETVALGSRNAPIKTSATYFIERSTSTYMGAEATTTISGREYGPT